MPIPRHGSQGALRASLLYYKLQLQLKNFLEEIGFFMGMFQFSIEVG